VSRALVLAVVSLAWSLPARAQPPDQPPEQPPARPVAVRVGLALVIGNSRYAQAELPSVEIDRTTMGQALEAQGFTVRVVENVERGPDFVAHLRDFLDAEDATLDDILVVYYSGHGMQINGRAHLLGTGIKGTPESVEALRPYAAEVDSFIREMENAAPSARVLIVDACRNNAFARTTRRAGTALQQGVPDTYVLYADEPGKAVPARSETTLQSPFTAALLFAFESSDGGIEQRFGIAAAKTRELVPDQTPQLLKSDSSPDRSFQPRPFLDRGGRAAPTRSAGRMLNDAEAFYRAGAWDVFQEKVHAARVLSNEPDLTRRLEQEVQFATLVRAALAAESHAEGAKWSEAAAQWQKAGALFPARVWTLEKAAIGWLLADRVQEATEVLARVKASGASPVADRAGVMLSSLLKSYPSLETVANAAAAVAQAPGGPEFERYIARQ
jgi:hypothetical protein